jgi:hypothetical protein
MVGKKGIGVTCAFAATVKRPRARIASGFIITIDRAMLRAVPEIAGTA